MAKEVALLVIPAEDGKTLSNACAPPNSPSPKILVSRFAPAKRRVHRVVFSV